MWQQISRHDFSAYKAPYTGEYLTICMGNEWHYFGSHFFMPSMMRLGFVEEDFHGLLPQYYASVNGTRRTDTQLVSAFNDLNQEDKKKYTHLLACDFVLSSEPATTLVKRMQTVSDSSSTPRNLKRRVTNTSVKPVIQTTVLDVDASRATIARAFYLPGYSDKKNQCKNYTLYHLS